MTIGVSAHIEGRLNEGPRLQQKKHKYESEAKQNPRNTTQKYVMASANQTPGRYKFAPLVTSHQGRANQHESVRLLWDILSLVLPVTFVHTTACRSSALTFSAAIHFAMKCSAPPSAVLRHSPSSWAAVVHWSALKPKGLRSSREHPIHYFSWPPTQPALPTNSPNITHFGSLVSFKRATNPANKIRLLRKVASVLSLAVLISVFR